MNDSVTPAASCLLAPWSQTEWVPVVIKKQRVGFQIQRREEMSSTFTLTFRRC